MPWIALHLELIQGSFLFVFCQTRVLSWATGEVNKWTAPGAIRVLKSSVYDVFLLSRGEGEHAERDHLTRQSGLSPAERGNDHQRIPEPNPVAKEAKMRYNEFTDLMLNPDES